MYSRVGLTAPSMLSKLLPLFVRIGLLFEKTFEFIDIGCTIIGQFALNIN